MVKKIYTVMIKNSNLSKLEKEIHCFVLWVLIHELLGVIPKELIDFYGELQFDRKFFHVDNCPGQKVIIRDFEDDFKRFKPKVFTKKIYKQGLKEKIFPFNDNPPFEEMKSMSNILGFSNGKGVYIFYCTLLFSRNRIRELYLQFF